MIVNTRDLLIASTENIIPRADRHILGGVIKINGVPVSMRVTAFHKPTFELVAQTWSDPTTGVWKISHTLEYPENEIYVIAWNKDGIYNAEIADFVSQEAFA